MSKKIGFWDFMMRRQTADALVALWRNLASAVAISSIGIAAFLKTLDASAIASVFFIELMAVGAMFYAYRLAYLSLRDGLVLDKLYVSRLTTVFLWGIFIFVNGGLVSASYMLLSMYLGRGDEYWFMPSLVAGSVIVGFVLIRVFGVVKANWTHRRITGSPESSSREQH